MKQYIIYLFNTRQTLKRELRRNSTLEAIKAYSHITNRLKDELC
jgi:hypothetical protein